MERIKAIWKRISESERIQKAATTLFLLGTYMAGSYAMITFGKLSLTEALCMMILINQGQAAARERRERESDEPTQQ